MVAAVVSIYESLTTKNFLFENANAPIGENLLAPWMALKKWADAHGIMFTTPDMVFPEDVDRWLFLDMPAANNKWFRLAKKSGKPMFLLIGETPMIHKANADLGRHTCFRKIFTFQDSLIDNKKYFKLNYSFDLPREINKAPREKFCCMIAGNKSLNHPQELYSERLAAIDWFEKHHPDEFDLYGAGWNHWLRSLVPFWEPAFKTYRGKVEKKSETLSQYRFSICYENIRDDPGWITEKIFDCFFAGCIPVYRGANNVAEHIPKECFIDKRLFSSYEELYTFLKNMSESLLQRIRLSIQEFLNSPKSYQFSTNYFIETLLKETLS